MESMKSIELVTACRIMVLSHGTEATRYATYIFIFLVISSTEMEVVVQSLGVSKSQTYRSTIPN